MGSMANASGQIDTRIEIVTPENIAFQYRVAGPFRRLPAYLIDMAIRVGVAVVGMIAAALVFGVAGVGTVGIGLGLLLWFGLSWFYGGLFEALWNGQTPGKRLMGIRVVSVEGQPITPFQAILRNILRVVDAQPGGLLSDRAAGGDAKRSLPAAGRPGVGHDGRDRGGTASARGRCRFSEPEAIRIAALIPPTFQPSRSLARALAAYVQRRQLFPWGRRLEIARHVGEPLRAEVSVPGRHGSRHAALRSVSARVHRRTRQSGREQPAPQGRLAVHGHATKPGRSADSPQGESLWTMNSC